MGSEATTSPLIWVGFFRKKNLDEKFTLSLSKGVQVVPERIENVQWTFLVKDRLAALAFLSQITSSQWSQDHTFTKWMKEEFQAMPWARRRVEERYSKPDQKWSGFFFFDTCPRSQLHHNINCKLFFYHHYFTYSIYVVGSIKFAIETRTILEFI